MAATIDTEFGQVSVSNSYYSNAMFMNVVNLTLIKPENKENGYGVCREVPANLSITPELASMFAREASQLL